MDSIDRTRVRAVVMTLVTLGLLMQAVAAQRPPERSTPSSPLRIAEMQRHFVQVTIVHEAIIRGDLAAVRPAAKALAALPTPVDVPADTRRFVEAIRAAAGRAAVAPTLASAATEVVTMLRQCSSCHQAAKVYPVASSIGGPDVGGIVGHMLQHQRGANELLQGLLIPSETRWREGATRLNAAKLGGENWPPDPKLTLDVRQADPAIHALATRALGATTGEERAQIYGQLISLCASCHSLHAKVWGPRSQ